MTAQSSPETFDGKFFPATQSFSGFAATAMTEAARPFAPMTRQTTQASSEIAQLAARRLAAWSDHQKRLLACRQPADVVAAAQTFWTRAFDDYSACNKALIATWSSGFSALMAPMQAAGALQRDVLSIRDGAADRTAESDPRRVDARRDAA